MLGASKNLHLHAISANHPPSLACMARLFGSFSDSARRPPCDVSPSVATLKLINKGLLSSTPFLLLLARRAELVTQRRSRVRKAAGTTDYKPNAKVAR